mmetsp:Transcript_43952/g.104005  ORF Transcript_43952/g.104005 Transcript_43952/m.104005 type:complete len:233 (+) Transcript_43952:643-1341(+)
MRRIHGKPGNSDGPTSFSSLRTWRGRDSRGRQLRRERLRWQRRQHGDKEWRRHSEKRRTYGGGASRRGRLRHHKVLRAAAAGTAVRLLAAANKPPHHHHQSEEKLVGLPVAAAKAGVVLHAITPRLKRLRSNLRLLVLRRRQLPQSLHHLPRPQVQVRAGSRVLRSMMLLGGSLRFCWRKDGSLALSMFLGQLPCPRCQERRLAMTQVSRRRSFAQRSFDGIRTSGVPFLRK